MNLERNYKFEKSTITQSLCVSFICDENLILRLSDDANIKPEWFVMAEEL